MHINQTSSKIMNVKLTQIYASMGAIILTSKKDKSFWKESLQSKVILWKNLSANIWPREHWWSIVLSAHYLR